MRRLAKRYGFRLFVPLFIWGLLLLGTNMVCSGAELSSGAALPEDPQSLALLRTGRQLLDQRYCVQALAAFCQYSLLHSEDPEGYFWQGIAFDEMGRYSDGAAAYQRAILKAANKGMDSAEIRVDLANVLLKSKFVDEAIVQYRKAIEVDPRLSFAQLNLARALIEKGDYQPALSCLERARDLGFSGSQLTYYKAKALFGLGKKKEAISQINRLLPELPEVQKKLLINEFHSTISGTGARP